LAYATRFGYPIGASPLTLQRAWVDLPSSAARRQPRMMPSATSRNSAASMATRRQLDTDAREVLDDARVDLDQALADGPKLRERVCMRNEGTPCSGSVEGEPHLIGRRAAARHPVRRQFAPCAA
jgi:hypothetical protein